MVQLAFLLRCRLGAAVVCLLPIGQLSSHGTTFWTGPDTNWTKSASTPSDAIIPGRVVLTRGNYDVLYNVAAGESSATTPSPKGTLWAFGDLTDATRLSYQTLESMRSGNLSTRLLGKAMVVHLINEDIYFSIKFTVWGRMDAGTVAYTRSTPPPGVPIVGIGWPVEGSVFANPADLKVTVDTTVTGGEVTNASLYAETKLLGSVTAAPFIVGASNLVAGSYSLSAVATAAGVSATSGIVHITVVAPVDITLVSPAKSDGFFSFSYTANPGLRYVIQRAASGNLLNAIDWTTVVTNAASSNPMKFTEELSTNALHLFRVGRLPNP